MGKVYSGRIGDVQSRRKRFTVTFRSAMRLMAASAQIRISGRTGDKPDYRGRLARDIMNRSLTASLNFCLHPMYRSVVWTEA